MVLRVPVQTTCRYAGVFYQKWIRASSGTVRSVRSVVVQRCVRVARPLMLWSRMARCCRPFFRCCRWARAFINSPMSVARGARDLPLRLSPLQISASTRTHLLVFSTANAYAGEITTDRFVNLRRTSAAEALSEGLFHSRYRAQKPADSTPFSVQFSLLSWRRKYAALRSSSPCDVKSW